MSTKKNWTEPCYDTLQLICCSLIDKTDYATQEWIERVVILGAPSGIKGAKLTSQSMYFCKAVKCRGYFVLL